MLVIFFLIVNLKAKLGRPTLSIDGKAMSSKERKRRSRSILKRKANQIEMWAKSHDIAIGNCLAFVCFVVYFLNPVEANAAWVYFPSDVTRIYASDIATYTVFTSPSGTMVFDSTLKTFVDIASIVPANQPPLNPIMTGLPVVSYGSPPFVLNEVEVIAGVKEVLPVLMLALFSGFAAAFLPAYLIKFLRESLNNTRGVS